MTVFIFRPTSGTPALVARAELRGARIFCESEELREWLQDAVDQLVAESGVPSTDSARAAFLERLCRLRSNERLFCSTSPLAT